MSQQVTLPEANPRSNEPMIIHPATLTAELPRSVRGYSVDAVDRLVAELESRQSVFQSKLNKAEEGNKRLIEDLSRCAAELAAFREKESTLLSALLAVEERKQSIGAELDSSRSTAQQQIKEMVERATLETSKLRTDSEEEAREIVERARLDADNITSSVSDIEERARRRADEIIEHAREEADSIKASVSSAEITAKARAEEIVRLAESDAERILTDATSRRQEYISDADEMLETARAEAAAERSRAEAECAAILADARSQADALLAGAKGQAEAVTKDIDAARTQKARQLEQLQAEFGQSVTLIRQTAQALLASIPDDLSGEVLAAVSTEAGFVKDAKLAAA